jgi:hypothetical protein
MSLRLPVAAAAIALLAAGAAVNAQTVLDFEDADIPTATEINAQYGSRGVLFHNAHLEADAAAHSGARVLRAVKTGDEAFTAKPLVITFASLQTRVKLFAGSQFSSLNGTLTAFDGLGNAVDTDGPRLVAANVFTTPFEVTTATASIDRVEFQLENSSYASIDDLEFEGLPPPPPPTQGPVVQLTQPVDGIEVDIPGDLPRLDIAGTVTGEGLLPQVTVTVAYKRPPESASLPPLTLVLDLTGTGTTRQFTLAGGMTPLPLGPITVTATAENVVAARGTDTSTLTNLPLAVTNRFGTDGGAATYGDFQYGLLGACAIAVYERGAISGRNGGAIAVRGDVFTKWLSLRGPLDELGWFGCPKNEEGETLAGARSQPFDRGRIYARLPGVLPPTAFYVPAVFADAIANRGDDPSIGLPLSDPSDSTGPMRTWLFQRFSRPDAVDPVPLLPSTLEIRGTPPILWMERQAGNWLNNQPGIQSRAFCRSDVNDQGFRCAFDKERTKSGATWWEGFPCLDSLGPCPVAAEPEFPPPIPAGSEPDFANQFCNGTLYRPGLAGPPEWKAIRGEYDATPVFGATVSAHMADIDNGLTHQTHNATCPYLGAQIAIGSVLIPPLTPFGAYVVAEENGYTCASDFEFFVRPLGPQIDTRPQLPSLFGLENTDNIKTEYEVAYAAAAHNFLGPPDVGDLVHMTGRWILDCGHPSYKTELHPIFSFARMKTVVSETNTFTGLEETLFGGKPATRVAIWVNGWYPGGDNNAIEFDIFPPPRPSPTSLLRVVKPVDSGPGDYQAAKDVTLDYAIGPPGGATRVHLRFTSPRRENTVTSEGEMLFAPGRQYWGIWYLYWGD